MYHCCVYLLLSAGGKQHYPDLVMLGLAGRRTNRRWHTEKLLNAEFGALTASKMLTNGLKRNCKIPSYEKQMLIIPTSGCMCVFNVRFSFFLNLLHIFSMFVFI